MFDDPPGCITGVVIMTDSDNTGGQATGFYGDIVFMPKSQAKK